MRCRGCVAAYGGALARCGLYPRGCGCVRCRGCVARGERGARKTAAAAAAVSPFRAPGDRRLSNKCSGLTKREICARV